MKLITLLLLCGVTWCIPENNCQQNVDESCRKKLSEDDNEVMMDVPQDEDKLNQYCKVIRPLTDCKIQGIEECGDADAYKNYLIKYSKILEKLCTEGEPLREKYLNNVSCMLRTLEKVSEECSYEIEDICEKRRKEYQCLETRLMNECGEAARDVFFEFSAEEELRCA